MKIFKIQQVKNPEAQGYISAHHFGYDPQVKRIRWHGTYCAKELWLGDPIETLEKLDATHRWCIRFPWPATFRKDLYELSTGQDL